jgi:hypothetical protein
MSPASDPASASPVEPAARLSPGALIDLLRAGLQVAGVGLAYVAVSERLLAGSARTNDLAPFLVLAVLAAALASRLGFPSRPVSTRALLARFAGVILVGGAMALGAAVGFANALEPAQSGARAAGCAALGLAIAALGVWPRRSVEGARPSALADALIGGGPLVLPALAGAAYVEAWRGWALAPFAAVSPRAGSAGAIVAIVLIVAFLVALGAAAWLARAERRSRAIVLVAPALALVGAFVGVRSRLGAWDGPFDGGPLYAGSIERRGAALADASRTACAGPLVAALLLGLGAIALGVRASRRGPAVAGARREVAVVAALATTPEIYAFFSLVRLEHLGESDRLVTFVAAVPAALATVGVWLAARGAEDRDDERAREASVDLVVAAGLGLGALALASLGRAIVTEIPAADTSFSWRDLAPALHGTYRWTALATSAHAVPVLVLCAAALPRRKLGPALARAAAPLAGVALLSALPAALFLSEVSSAAATLHAPWNARVPAGLTLPEIPADERACDLDLDDVLFVGETRLFRGGRDLGATDQLDAEPGCVAVATALDQARDGRTDAPRFAADARVSWGRLECFVAALTARRSPGPVRLDWLATQGGSGGPGCIPLRVVDDRPPQSGAAEPKTARAAPALRVLTGRGAREAAGPADPSPPAQTLRDLARVQIERDARYLAVPLLAYAATPEVSAGAVLAMLAGESGRSRSDRATLLLADAGASPRADAAAPAAGAARFRSQSPGAAGVLEGLGTPLSACIARADPSPGQPLGGALFLLLGPDGRLARAFVGEGSEGSPEAKRCLRDVLATAAWPAADTLVAVRYDRPPAAPAP